LQENLSVELAGVKSLPRGLGNQTAQVNPANPVDMSLLQDMEREGFLQTRTR